MPGAGEAKWSFRCTRCGNVTWGDLQFCSECGQSLTISCPGCGATWRYMYEYPFCPSCGAKTGQKKGQLFSKA